MIKIFRNIENHEIPSAVGAFIVGGIFLTILTIISLPLFLFSRIPKGKKVVYEGLIVRVKAIVLPCIYRDFIESLLGYRTVLLVVEEKRKVPYFLYIHYKEMDKFPQELWKYNNPKECRRIGESLEIDIEVRASLLCGYLPAKIIGSRVIDKKLEWSK